MEEIDQRHFAKIKSSKAEIFLDSFADKCNFFIHCIINLPNKIDIKRIYKAMLLVAEKEPKLISKLIKTKSNRLYWIYCKYPDLDIEEIYSNTENVNYSDCLLDVQEPSHGTYPISIRLIHQKNSTTIHIRICHILTDGGGAKQLIYDLATAYKNMSELRTPQPIPLIHDTLIKKIVNYLNRHNIYYLVIGLIKDKKTLLFTDDYFTIPMSEGDGKKNKVLLLKLEKNRVAKLSKYAKSSKATLNDILVTAFSRALSSCFSSYEYMGKQIGIIIMSDMRKYIGLKSDFSNMTNWTIIKTGTIPLPCSSTQLEKVIIATKKWKKNLTGFGNILFNLAILNILPESMIRFIFGKLKFAPDDKRCRIGLTNFGLLNSRKIDFGCGPCTYAYMLPPILSPPFILAGASGCNESITFSIGYKEDVFNDSIINKILEALDRELMLMEQITLV